LSACRSKGKTGERYRKGIPQEGTNEEQTGNKREIEKEIEIEYKKEGKGRPLQRRRPGPLRTDKNRTIFKSVWYNNSMETKPAEPAFSVSALTNRFTKCIIIKKKRRCFYEKGTELGGTGYRRDRQ
jgi:hypothetical protein